jgi:zinc protease
LAVLLGAAAAVRADGEVRPGALQLPDGWRAFHTPAGATVCMIEGRESGYTAMALTVPSGRRDVRARRAGASGLLARWLETGTTRLTERELNRALGGAGARVVIRAYYDRTLVLATSPSETARQTLALAADVLWRPRLEAATFERTRRFLAEDFGLRGQFPAAGFEDAVYHVLFAPHPFGRPPGGTRAGLARCTPAAVRALHARHFAPSQTTVVVVGPMARPDVEAALAGAPTWPRPEPAVRAGLALRRPERRHFEWPGVGSRKGFVFAGWVIERRVDASDRLKLALMEELLSGVNGRLTREIRTRHGLTYAPEPESELTRDGGLWGVRLMVQGKAVKETRRRLRAELARLEAEPPRGEELESARAAVRATLAQVFERADLTATLVAGRLAQGVVVGDYASERRRLDAVDADALAAFIRETLPARRALVVSTAP